MSPTPKPDAKARRALRAVEIASEELSRIDRLYSEATNNLWSAMRKARKAGATLGQLREASEVRLVVQGVEMGMSTPRYSRSRVQQITKGYGA